MAILEFLFGWSVVGPVVAVVVTIGAMLMGVTPLTTREFVGAKALFTFAAALLIVKFFAWLATSVPSRTDRLVGSVLVLGSIGFFWSEAWLWVNARQSHGAAPPAHSTTKEPRSEPDVIPLARIAVIRTLWIEGAEPVIEVENRSEGPIDCRGVGRILKAERVHRRRDSFPAYWRGERLKDGWVRFEQGDKKKVMIAFRSVNSYGGEEFVRIAQQGGLDAEVWRMDEFRSANMFYEFETRPPLREHVHSWYQLTWNARQRIFELGRPVEDDDDDRDARVE